MRLLFDDITRKTQRYFISDTHWFAADDAGFRLLAATAHLSVTRYDHETIIVKGELTGRRETVCDRCGERVEDELQSEFEYQATVRKEEAQELREVECSDDDAVTLYLEEPVIDIDNILREQAYLAVPLRTLCREDCKGICAGCGALLNTEPCRCSPDTSNSPFAVLKKIGRQ